MNRLVAGALLAVACAVGSGVTLLVTGARLESVLTRPSKSAPSLDVTPLRRKERFGTPPATIERHPMNVPGDVTVETKPREEADQLAKPSDAEQPKGTELEAPTDEERFAFAESVFESQAHDAWARDSAQALTNVLSTLTAPSVRTNSVGCRSNLCRIEIAADNSEAGESYVRNFIRSAKWTSPGMIVRDEPDSRGAYVLRIYLTRAGIPLPEPAIHGPEP